MRPLFSSRRNGLTNMNKGIVVVRDAYCRGEKREGSRLNSATGDRPLKTRVFESEAQLFRTSTKGKHTDVAPPQTHTRGIHSQAFTLLGAHGFSHFCPRFRSLVMCPQRLDPRTPRKLIPLLKPR